MLSSRDKQIGNFMFFQDRNAGLKKTRSVTDLKTLCSHTFFAENGTELIPELKTLYQLVVNELLYARNKGSFPFS